VAKLGGLWQEREGVERLQQQILAIEEERNQLREENARLRKATLSEPGVAAGLLFHIELSQNSVSKNCSSQSLQMLSPSSKALLC
jgi:hypothetical protein